MNYTIKKSEFLPKLMNIFSGNYDHSNSEISKMRDEIFDISHTPNAHDDKDILKGDFNTFLKDTQKANKK